MDDVKLKFVKISDILKFTEIVRQCSNQVVAKQNTYTVDAKSIMGLFSLDLLQPVIVSGLTDDIKNKLKAELDIYD